MSSELPTSVRDHRFSDARHGEIVDRLQTSKSLGLITDFFVSWIGVNGHLNPIVRVWRNPEVSEFDLREHIRTSLSDMINMTDLTIVDGDRVTSPILL